MTDNRTDAGVFEALQAAGELYERYLELSRIAQLPCEREEDFALMAHSGVNEVGLVIKSHNHAFLEPAPR